MSADFTIEVAKDDRSADPRIIQSLDAPVDSVLIISSVGFVGGGSTQPEVRVHSVYHRSGTSEYVTTGSSMSFGRHEMPGFLARHLELGRTITIITPREVQ